VAYTNEAARWPKIAISLGKYSARESRARTARGPKSQSLTCVGQFVAGARRCHAAEGNFRLFTQENLKLPSAVVPRLFSVLLAGALYGRTFNFLTPTPEPGRPGGTLRRYVSYVRITTASVPEQDPLWKLTRYMYRPGMEF
jgi:hypothetical protein